MEPSDRERFNHLLQRLEKLEKQVAFLFKNLGVEFHDTTPPPDEITQLVIKGDKLEAIRLYRERSGVGLAEARTFVLDLSVKLGV